MKGIYGYWDREKFEYRYIGKDSHIDENKRHKAHLQPSLYDAQTFNCVLQNNPDRFEYQVFISGDFTDEELNELEMHIIKSYGTFESDTGFNFTPGGDGFGFGEDSPLYRHDLDDDVLVREFCENELSCYEIARKYNTGFTTVQRRLNKHGIDTSRDAKKNTSGYYRVGKCKDSSCKQGFNYRYRYYDENGKQKTINSVDLKKLEVRVKEKGLPWKKL